MSIAIGNTCYAYADDTVNYTASSFDAGYQACASMTVSVWRNITGFGYGRLATFQTPTAYQCVMEKLAAATSKTPILIGAHNKGQGGGRLTEFLWARTTGTDDGCAILSGTTDPAGVNITKVGSAGTNWMVLAANPQAPWNFYAYNQNATSNLGLQYLCEFGMLLNSRLRLFMTKRARGCLLALTREFKSEVGISGCGTPPTWSVNPQWDQTPVACGSVCLQPNSSLPNRYDCTGM